MSEDIKKIRKKIDSLDEEILVLLNKRAQEAINISKEKQKSENDYLTYLNDLRVQVELIRKSIMNYSEIIPINQDVVSSAEEDLKVAQERYSIGSATILEVLDAQVSVVRARSSLIRTKYDAYIQQANLKALLGTLDKAIN